MSTNQVLIGVIVQVTKESVEGDLSGVTNRSKSWCLFSHAKGNIWKYTAE